MMKIQRYEEKGWPSEYGEWYLVTDVDPIIAKLEAEVAKAEYVDKLEATVIKLKAKNKKLRKKLSECMVELHRYRRRYSFEPHLNISQDPFFRILKAHYHKEK
jgi:hypothetical protein